jgi:hypothetical protein
MAAFANISLQDGQATPVTHVFAPFDHSNDTYQWRETATGSVLSAAVISLAKLKAKVGAGLEKFRLKVYVPVLETVSGVNALGYTAAPRLAYSLQSQSDFICPSRATTQQRVDLVTYTRNLMATSATQIQDAITLGLMPN